MTRARESAVTAFLVLCVAGFVALQVAGDGQGHRRPRPVAPVAHPLGLRVGVTTGALARNAYTPWKKSDLVEVNAFEQDAQRHADIIMWYADWAHTRTFDAAQARAVRARGSTPEISWEPWDSSVKLGAPQPLYNLRSIAGGRHDAYIARWARGIAAYGGPVMIRFAQEMNGGWYPWGVGANGNRPGDFTAAWRHVHAIFARAGAHNVTWVWAPVAGHAHPDLYPGDDQVDVIGVSGFNGGGSLFRHRWRSFATSVGPTIERLHWQHPGKPMEISEVASVDGGKDGKARWIDGMFAELARRPYVRSFNWFQLRKEADWRIQSSRGAQQAFARGLAFAEAQPNVATRSR